MEVDELGGLWPRADQAHGPAQDVQQLWDLVDPQPREQTTDARETARPLRWSAPGRARYRTSFESSASAAAARDGQPARIGRRRGPRTQRGRRSRRAPSAAGGWPAGGGQRRHRRRESRRRSGSRGSTIGRPRPARPGAARRASAGRQRGDLVRFRRRGGCFPSSTEAHWHRSPEAECFRSGSTRRSATLGGGLYRGGSIDRISVFSDAPRLRTQPFMELARSHGVRTTCVNGARACCRRRLIGSGQRLRRFILPVSRCTATGRLMTTATAVQ